MATDDKDRLGEKLRDKQKGEEDRYFAERDRAALERLRQQREATRATAAPELNRCPRCGVELVMIDHLGVSIDECPNGHGTWLDKGELEVLSRRENDSWLGRLFTRPKR
jgi:hypothetical protein